MTQLLLSCVLTAIQLALVGIERRLDLVLRVLLGFVVRFEQGIAALANANRRERGLDDPESTWLHVRHNPNNFAALFYPQATSR